MAQQGLTSVTTFAKDSTDQQKMYNSMDLKQNKMYRRPLPQCIYEPLNFDNIEHNIHLHILKRHYDNSEIYRYSYQEHPRWEEIPSRKKKPRNLQQTALMLNRNHPTHWK